MNFPFFHQVMVAGGLEPTLRHSNVVSRFTANGSSGREIDTERGSTAKDKDKKVVKKHSYNTSRI